MRADVEEIVRVGGRAGELTQQLLAFSRQQVLEPRAVDLNSIVRESATALRRLAGDAVELELRFDPLLAPAEIDAAQIEHVLHDLVGNARDAMPDGGRPDRRDRECRPGGDSRRLGARPPTSSSPSRTRAGGWTA